MYRRIPPGVHRAFMANCSSSASTSARAVSPSTWSAAVNRRLKPGTLSSRTTSGRSSPLISSRSHTTLPWGSAYRTAVESTDLDVCPAVPRLPPWQSTQPLHRIHGRTVVLSVQKYPLSLRRQVSRLSLHSHGLFPRHNCAVFLGLPQNLPTHGVQIFQPLWSALPPSIAQPCREACSPYW